MPISETKLRELILTDEGQYHDRKSLLTGPPAQKRPRDRREVRDQIAEQVAGFANADGGVLILGVEDDGTLTGHRYPPDVVEDMLRAPEIRLVPPQARGYAVTLDGHELLIFEIEPAARAVRVDGDGYPFRIADATRQYSEEKINGLKDLGLVESAEARTVRVEVATLDGALIAEAARLGGLEHLSPADYLVRRRLADRRGAELVLRQAAVLLFASETHTIEHPNAGVRVFRVAGAERLTGARHNVQEFPRFEGNLPGVLARVRQLLDTLIHKSSQLRDLFFEERPEYPTFTWQEALVNAVVHRDYATQGQTVEVWLYSDRLEISSPGAPPDGVSLDDLNEGRPAHVTRNPRIARVLADLEIMRDQGEGIRRMFEEMLESYLSPPALDLDHGRFRVVLRKEPIRGVDDLPRLAAVRALPIAVTQKRALLALRDGEFANSDYVALNAVDRDTAYRELHDLVERGLIATSGDGAGTRYRVAILGSSNVTLDPVTMVATATVRDTPLSLFIARMKAAGFVTNADYREAFGVSSSVASKALSSWVAADVLTREGERKGARYRPGPAWPPRSKT